MKKIIFIALFALIANVTRAHYPEIVKVRSGFIYAVDHKDSREAYALMLEGLENNMHSKAYLGAAKTLVAECVMMPWAKYSYFKYGSRLIEEAIKENPLNAEYRYLRFLIQFNAPSFLDYYSNLGEDYRAVTSAIKSNQSKEVWMEYFIQFEKLNKEKIEAILEIS